MRSNPNPNVKTGANGADGLDGRDGVDGTDGMDGQDGRDGNFGLGDAGMIAVGGLVGDNGIGGTGLLANLGDPSTSPPIAGGTTVSLGETLSETGEQIAATAESSEQNVVDDVVVAAADTVSATGDSLTRFGTGEQPLVDGVLEAPSPLVTASLGAADAVGGSDNTNSLIGASVLSAEQESGDVGTVGVASDDTLLTVDLAPDSEGSLDVPGVATVDIVGGEADLIDGSTTLLAANALGESETVGGDAEDALVGLSVLSEDQAEGSLLEAGAASDETLLNVDLAPNSDDGLEIPGIANLDVVGGEGDLLDASGLSDPVSETDNGLLTDIASGVEDATEDLTDTAQDLLSDEEGTSLLDGVSDAADEDAEGGLGGLLSGLGGGR